MVDKVYADKTVPDRVVADKVIADKVIADRVVADRVVQDSKLRVYECYNPNYSIATENGVIGFTPVRDDVTNEVFGVFDTGNKFFQKMLRRTDTDEKTGKETVRDSTPEELAAEIESTKAFRQCATSKTVGVKGIWLQEDRLKVLRARVGASAPSNTYESLTVDELKIIIEKRGGKYSPEAKKDELVRILTELKGGK